MTELSDELLVAYVDGQLARKQSSAVEKVLAQDDVIARRVAALKDAHSRLEAAFEAILAGEEADAAAQPVPRWPGLFIAVATRWSRRARRGGHRRRTRPACRRLWLAARRARVRPRSLGAGDPTMSAASPHDWQEEAARAQALLGRASLEIGLDSQGNRDFIAFQLGQAIGPRSTPPDLAPQGFRFVRAQLLQLRRASLWRSSSISARAARRLRFTPRRARAKSRAAVQALWRARRRGLVARTASPISSPETRDEAALLRLAETIRSGKTQRTLPPTPPALASAPPHRRRGQAAWRLLPRHARRRRVVAGKIAVEVAPDRGCPLLVAIVDIVLDPVGDRLARVVVGVLDLRHLLRRDARLAPRRREVRPELIGIEHEAAMARARRCPADLNRPCQRVLRRDVARLLLGGGALFGPLTRSTVPQPASAA